MSSLKKSLIIVVTVIGVIFFVVVAWLSYEYSPSSYGTPIESTSAPVCSQTLNDDAACSSPKDLYPDNALRILALVVLAGVLVMNVTLYRQARLDKKH